MGHTSKKRLLFSRHSADRLIDARPAAFDDDYADSVAAGTALCRKTFRIDANVDASTLPWQRQSAALRIIVKQYAKK